MSIVLWPWIKVVKMDSDLSAIKNKVIFELKNLGFNFDENVKIQIKNKLTKDDVRQFHSKQKKFKLLKDKEFIKNNLNLLQENVASGSEVNIEKFCPILVPVEDDVTGKIFRIISLLWSIPVSVGFGRRQRFIVLDKYNNKVIGIFSLSDPVFNLSVRDKYIGWSTDNRKQRLYNVMDLNVLGAIPPYSNLLCGKLIALIAASSKVSNYMYGKYFCSQTIIQKVNKNPSLALLTTTSALGKSSIYNRVKFNDKLIYNPLGMTLGWGHFHFSNGLHSIAFDYLKSIEHPICKKYEYGSGPNWKIRMYKTFLKEIGLPQGLMMHQIQREVYAVPLAHNFKEYLTGKDNSLELYNYRFEDIVKYFKTRWFEPRSKRNQQYFSFEKESLIKSLYEA